MDTAKKQSWAKRLIQKLEEVTGEPVPRHTSDTIHAVDEFEMFQKPGRKPINPEGPMTRAQKSKKGEIRKKIEKHGGIKQLMSTDEGEFIEFTESFDRFIKGEEVGLYRGSILDKYDTASDIDGNVSKNNRYLKLLYMASENERSFRRMCSNLDIHYRRLTVLINHNHKDYSLFEKEGSYIKATEHGEKFLHNLFPYLKSDSEKPNLSDYLEENVCEKSF
jgi:hypothetical protein